MQPGTLDARSVRDQDGLIFFHAQAVVRPFVADDVPRALTVARPVTFVVPQEALVEVRLTEVRREFRRKPERLVCGKRISVTVQIIPQTREASRGSEQRKAAPGWPCDAEMERLRDAFAHEEDDGKRKEIATQVQARAIEIGTHVWLGQ